MNELMVKAICAELANQRNAALDRCANLCAEIAALQARVKELEPQEKTELQAVR